jgi:hypothetical protein
MAITSMWLVTLKLPRNPTHNPHDKKTGPCPVNGKPCTDQTGEHHTVLHQAQTESDVRVAFRHYHITRIEKA